MSDKPKEVIASKTTTNAVVNDEDDATVNTILQLSSALASTSIGSSSAPSTRVVRKFTTANKKRTGQIPTQPSNGQSLSHLSNSATLFPLYDDVIKHAIEWLDARDMHTAIQLSKQWQNVISTTKSIGLRLKKSSYGLQSTSNNSAVARHVASVEIWWAEATAPLLLQLSTWFPNITSMRLDSLLDQVATFSPASVLVLPKNLEYLQGNIDYKYFSMVVAALAPLSRLQTLQIGIQLRSKVSQPPMELDFSPLLPHSLPQLRTLQLTVWQEADATGPIVWSERVVTHPLSPSAIQFLRQLSLTDMNLRIYAVTLNRVLDQLSADPTSCPLLHSGNLHSINMTSMKVDGDLLRALAKFTSLQQLHAGNWEITDQRDLAATLPLLPQLTDVMIANSKVLSPGTIVAACRLMPQLRKLTLWSIPLSTALLDEMLSHLPLLTSLSFQRCDGLTTLSPLLNHGIPQRLTELRITRPLLGATLPSSDLRKCIFPLKQLQYLFLDDIFTDADNSDFHSDAKQANLHSKSVFPNISFVSIFRRMRFPIG